ncbi:DEKNAAC101373 [Brettanomyces naardenensis]|uniref:DEKNAAC101373 n=1 Tax=Brettanomyces naardenensis TaxID=13370 RepID=A0A448YHH0_BRENA|nr:DEKNAAC101373 [Brettanomyces naardenensis]
MSDGEDVKKHHNHHHHDEDHRHHHHKKDSKENEDGVEEELEIDVNGDVPLSKKELRMVKKGQITLEDLQKKKKKKTGEIHKNTASATDVPTPGLVNNSKRTKYGVWIGNLSYETTKEDLIAFLVAKSADIEGEKDDESGEEGEEVEKEEEEVEEGEGEEAESLIDDTKLSKIFESDILRINMPSKGKINKGFAYVDFRTAAQQQAAVSLSELNLNGRDLLIKKSDSYEGRPARTFAASHNPPSKILFVGNLPFDITEDQLKEQFMHCGEITRVRMATFEDTGKCKGFAFIDFRDEEGPTAALKDRSCQRVMNRPLRMEYGSDRSKRRGVGANQPRNGGEERTERNSVPEELHPQRRSFRGSRDNDEGYSHENDSHRGFDRPKPTPYIKRPRSREDDYAPNKRLKSSIALANAQRENPAAKAQGKKIKF